jgi:aspartyl-tRNA synthetase
VMEFVSNLLYTTVKTVYPKKELMHPDWIPRITYAEAMDKYWCDKPDIRFWLELVNITHIVKDTNFNVFRNPIEAWWIVKCIKIAWEEIDAALWSWSYFGQKYKKNTLVEMAKRNQLWWLAYLEVHWDELQPNMNVEKLWEDICRKIIEEAWAKDWDTIFFAAEKEDTVNAALDVIRRELWKKLKLYKDNQLGFVRVVDFPMFETTEEGWWKFTHNPFSMPKSEHLDRFLNWENIGQIQAMQYDIALNGNEIGWGSIRAHQPHILRQTYAIMWYDEQQTEHSVGHMIEAFGNWAPPHWWLALGLDRIMMILERYSSIRDVMVFPKTWEWNDLMMKAPSPLSEETLQAVHIKTIKQEWYEE